MRHNYAFYVQFLDSHHLSYTSKQGLFRDFPNKPHLLNLINSTFALKLVSRVVLFIIFDHKVLLREARSSYRMKLR